MVETTQDQVAFISTEELAGLIDSSAATTRILNCSVKMGEAPEPFGEHIKKHIKGARWFDMNLCKD